MLDRTIQVKIICSFVLFFSGFLDKVPPGNIGGNPMRKVYAAITMAVAFSITGFSSTIAGTVPKPKLFLSADGLALSSFPSRNSLTETITVQRTDGGPPAAWSAASDQSWLTVTGGGITEGPLTVEANPSGLQKNKFYAAEVTVSTNGDDFTDQEILHVGFWVGSHDPVAFKITQSTVNGIVANPVEPFVYATDGSGSIYKYNVYSGKLDKTISTSASTLGALEASSDGRLIFAVDTTNNVVLALTSSGKPVGSYSLTAPIEQNMVYARPYGIPALFVSNNPVFAVSSGKVLATGVPGGAYLAVPPNGQSLFAVDVGVSPGTLYRYSFGLEEGQYALSLDKSSFMINPVASNCQDLAVSHNGAHVYPACGAPYEFDVYDGKSLNYTGKHNAIPYPNNIEVDENGRLIGGVNGEIFVFGPDGPIGKFPASGSMLPGGVKVSGDATRIIVASGTSLWFYNSP